MRRRLGLFAAVACAAALVPAAPAAAAPQCQYGPDVTADCPPGGCPPDDGTGQDQPCTGPLLDPLLPPGPPVRVELGIG